MTHVTGNLCVLFFSSSLGRQQQPLLEGSERGLERETQVFLLRSFIYRKELLRSSALDISGFIVYDDTVSVETLGCRCRRAHVGDSHNTAGVQFYSTEKEGLGW